MTSSSAMKELDAFTDRYVCILGLGYVGLTLAVSMADIGFKVLGVEIRDDVLALLNNGQAHFHEPGLQERLRRVIHSGNLICVKTIPDNISCTVFIITVGTPLNSSGKSRLDMVENVAAEVSARMRDSSLIVMRSTVKIGTTRRIVYPLLARTGKKFDLAFCPERTLEGKALVELRQLPQIVGGISTQASVRASQLFQFVTPTVVRVSSLETAEVIKLIDNAQRDVAFAYANEVAGICDTVGVSTAEVIQAGKLGYPRTNLPMPGPVGGPCLEKDSHILAEGTRELGYEPEITMAARRINEGQPANIVSYLSRLTSVTKDFPTKPVITLMGIAFKGQPPTDDLRGTMAKPILRNLQAAFPNASYRCFDPVVSHEDIKAFGLSPVLTLNHAFTDANLVLILNNHPIFSQMPLADLAAFMSKPAFIYDLWNCFNASDLHMPFGITYIALGSHSTSNLPSISFS